MSINFPQDFPVSQLSGRYCLARSAVYTRMQQLGITSRRIGRRAFITGRDLALMDELQGFIQAGGTAPEFLHRREGGEDDGG
ncbi:MAG: hypothetical protein VKL98_09025 [Cyanobacteriota bacterium]|nr:hypothetical protein [Cyanobacteriota bacterium]